MHVLMCVKVILWCSVWGGRKRITREKELASHLLWSASCPELGTDCHAIIFYNGVYCRTPDEGHYAVVVHLDVHTDDAASTVLMIPLYVLKYYWQYPATEYFYPTDINTML